MSGGAGSNVRPPSCMRGRGEKINDADGAIDSMNSTNYIRVYRYDLIQLRQAADPCVRPTCALLGWPRR